MSDAARSLDFASDGASLHAGAVDTAHADLARWLDEMPRDRAGVRIAADRAVALRSWLAADGPIGRVAAAELGRDCRPVRAILFDKSPAANWSLAWHQDRTICVAQRVEVKGFGPWTVKHGRHHVAPPAALLARMITLRVHFDDVSADNAPLLVALGSHRLGLVAENDIAAAVAQCRIHRCLARSGDIWRYATLILHASAAALHPRHRRVLQVDFAALDLPGGLRWAAV